MRARARVRRALASAVATALLVAAAGGCSDDGGDAPALAETTTLPVGAEPDPAATTTVVQPVGDPINRYSIVVGDCFNRYESINVITRLPCDHPHDREAYHYEIHPAPHGEPYPGDREMRNYALRICYVPFETFTGGLYELSRLEIGAITPTKENWEDSRARYRGITCFVSDRGGEQLVGSMRGRGE